MLESLVKRDTCVICDGDKEQGIHLYTKFICIDCEREIVHTETSNENYRYYLAKLKVIHSKIEA